MAPSTSYYPIVENLYAGDYRDAQRDYLQELRGAVKSVTSRWIDSICYHAMLGETYYHMGRLGDAMEQFNYAAEVYLHHPKWMLRVDFARAPTVDSSLARTRVPWGASNRGFKLGQVPQTLLISQGQIDNSNVVRRGGVVQQAQFWSVDVVEINRCIALTLRRRNELLGPLGKHDPLSQRMLRELMRGGAPPNHWSVAWVDLNRGLAHAGVGEIDAALERLAQGELLAGEFDHPLTCVSLLEQGRLEMMRDAGERADQLFAEASHSAYLYEDLGVIDEAFQLATINRLANEVENVHPALAPASAWARRKGFDHLASRLQLAWAEELMAVGQWSEAQAAFSAGQSRMRDAAQGMLGNWAQFLGARLEGQQGRDAGVARLEAALGARALMSPHNFQIELANRMVDQQALRGRAASDVYAELLADPGPRAQRYRLFDAVAVMKTSQQGAFDRWLDTALERKDLAAACDVIDANKRRRFHQWLPWGGRLAAFRRLLAGPVHALSADDRLLQQDLLTRWPDLDAALREETDARNELEELWKPAAGRDDLGKQQAAWRRLSNAIQRRELALANLAWERVAATYSFPPRRTLAELQASMLAGEALVLFHDAPEGMLGLLATHNDATMWNCGPSHRLGGQVAQLLRDLGNHDGNREVSFESLQDATWQKTAEQLYETLFAESALDPEALDELIVVPDGALWHLPMETLVAKTETHEGALTGFTRIRYAPTAPLALHPDVSGRRIRRSAVVLGKLAPGDDQAERLAAAQPLIDALENGLALPPAPPADAPAAASLLDQVVTLDESELGAADVWEWTPFSLHASADESLSQWSALAGRAPQRLLAPGVRTVAERGGKVRNGRRNANASPPGNELFAASCALMEAGVETMLISRWRVGGQSTLDLMREFAQELPHGPASAAWQRSIQLAAASPIDPQSELRVKSEPGAAETTAAHPFFWSGYLLVDSGWRGPEPLHTPAEPKAEPNVQPDAKPAAQLDAEPQAEPDADLIKRRPVPAPSPPSSGERVGVRGRS